MNGKCLQGYFSAAQNYKRRLKTYLILFVTESIGSKTSANSPHGADCRKEPKYSPAATGSLGGRNPSLCPLSCSSCPPFRADNTGTWASAMMAPPPSLLPSQKAEIWGGFPLFFRNGVGTPLSTLLHTSTSWQCPHSHNSEAAGVESWNHKISQGGMEETNKDHRLQLLTLHRTAPRIPPCTSFTNSPQTLAALRLWPLPWGGVPVLSHTPGDEPFPDIQPKHSLTQLQAFMDGTRSASWALSHGTLFGLVQQIFPQFRHRDNKSILCLIPLESCLLDHAGGVLRTKK